MLESANEQRHKLKKVSTSSLTSWAHRSADRFVDRLLDRRICLGITGFSRSGKSTFITSLLHQLTQHTAATLPAFSPILQGRYLGAEIHNLAGFEAMPFPYKEGVSALSSTPPSWPKSTTGMKGCLLEIRYKPKASLLSVPGRKFARLFVEICDYPGEWLLDLPLLELSYQAWCHECNDLFHKPPRKDLLGGLIHSLNNINPLDPIDTKLAAQLCQRYVNFLLSCKHQVHSLSMIQPGRFLMPGDKPIADLFIPLLGITKLSDAELATASPSSWYGTMRRYYTDYVDTFVKPFYSDYFSQIDRQLILVDVLQALHGGPEYLDDMRLGLTRVLDSFNYGQNNFLSRILSPRIDRVVFAATKIDQVLPDQHENVRALMSALVQEAYRKASFEQTDLQSEAVASVRATSMTEYKGSQRLLGTLLSGQAGMMSHPSIPDHIPKPSDWQHFQNWQLRQLQPPKSLDLLSGGTLPHIRIDTIIRDLLGDKC